MTDPTPTTPKTPPQGLTDAQLDALERQHWEATGVVSEAMQAEELFNYRAFARAAIAAHEAQRMEWLKGSREIAILTAAIDGRIAAHEAARAQPVPVAERPWERPGWCDAEGRCWWFAPTEAIPGGFRCAGWSLYAGDPADEDTHCLPHWAFPQPPQGGEVEQ